MRMIKLTESDLHKLISEAVSKVLVSEAIDIAKGVPEQVKKQYLKKMISEYPDLDPDGFFWIGNNLKHNGKKRSKSMQQPKVSKPEGMDDITYLTTIVPKYNKRFAKGIQTAKEIFQGEESPQYEPLDVSYFMDQSISQEFADRYYISQYGVICTSNSQDTGGCHISIPYFAPTRKMFQVNLRLYDENGKEIAHTCPSVVGLVRKVWGDKWANRLRDIEIEQIKNGNSLTVGDETDF